MIVYLAVNYPAPYRIKMLDVEAKALGWDSDCPITIENGRYKKHYAMETEFDTKPEAEAFASPIFEAVLTKVNCAMVQI